MENTATRPMAVRISQKPVQAVFTSHLDKQIANSEVRAQSGHEELVLEILESTQCIRRRTDNREIHAILDEIAWLVRSI